MRSLLHGRMWFQPQQTVQAAIFLMSGRQSSILSLVEGHEVLGVVLPSVCLRAKLGPLPTSQFMKSRHDWMQCDDKCFVSKSEGFSLPLIGLSRNAPWASFSWIHSDCKSMCRCLPNPRLLAIPLAAAESQCSSRGRTTPKSCTSPW